MKSNVTRFEQMSSHIVPPGEYQGIWGGHHVFIGNMWRLTTEDGVRGIDIPCTVTVEENGSASVVANNPPPCVA